jgi:hypothetical protein
LPPPDPFGVRISDSDRERAAERLHQGLAEGRITVAELEERVAAVYAAQYAAELRPPLADLPGDDLVAVPPVDAPPAAEPVVLRAGASGIKRTGEWSVPARLRVKSRMGSVVLDFCETVIPHPVVEIELMLGTGRPSCSCLTMRPSTSTPSSQPWARSRAPSPRSPGWGRPISSCAGARGWVQSPCDGAAGSLGCGSRDVRGDSSSCSPCGRKAADAYRFSSQAEVPGRRR